MGSEMICAVSVAALFSILLVVIDISRESPFSRAALLNGPVLLYLAIVIMGNMFSTMLAPALLAPAAVADFLANTPFAPTIPDDSCFDLSPRCFLLAIIGVFGFEIVLKKINVTFSDLGVLTLKEWIGLAKKAAVAHAVNVGAWERERKAQAVAQRAVTLSDEIINAYLIDLMGQQPLAQLEAAATAGNADPKLVKALALAKKSLAAASAIPVQEVDGD
uniref:Uncharacterized protein n=1 Tax=Candidatus Kentrum sp. LPFa TaxID=2126335 RepID=A0A450VYH9_9GAMM|nr:MAG: hypothetical protein BECKLPF1236A_GA0070988_1002811 [Candidatus Kentron sp. LPFa]VFK25698.1 MAG: hypothetical protein BECKLPF1236C_GA0070990_1002412 [Candidatus Kentron sp. LPFa]